MFVSIGFQLCQVSLDYLLDFVNGSVKLLRRRFIVMGFEQDVLEQ